MKTGVALLLLVFCCGKSLAISRARPSATRTVVRVLLLSIDGMHGLDLSNYIQLKPESALANLSRHGITYTNAHSSLVKFLAGIAGDGHRRISYFHGSDIRK
jgi:hypothetical protein